MTPKWSNVAQNGLKRPKKGPKWSITPIKEVYSFWSKMTKMAQNDPKMAQNGPKRVKNGLKTAKIGSEWVFMTFNFFRQKSQKSTKKGQKLTLKCPFLDHKMPIFSKMAKMTQYGPK